MGKNKQNYIKKPTISDWFLLHDREYEKQECAGKRLGHSERQRLSPGMLDLAKMWYIRLATQHPNTPSALAILFACSHQEPYVYCRLKNPDYKTAAIKKLMPLPYIKASDRNTSGTVSLHHPCWPAPSWTQITAGAPFPHPLSRPVVWVLSFISAYFTLSFLQLLPQCVPVDPSGATVTQNQPNSTCPLLTSSPCNIHHTEHNCAHRLCPRSMNTPGEEAFCQFPPISRAYTIRGSVILLAD